MLLFSPAFLIKFCTCHISKSPLIKAIIRHKMPFVDCHKYARKKKILYVIIIQNYAKCN